jgi:hypothetical protein
MAVHPLDLSRLVPVWIASLPQGRLQWSSPVRRHFAVAGDQDSVSQGGMLQRFPSLTVALGSIVFWVKRKMGEEGGGIWDTAWRMLDSSFH